jgi:ABC-type transport system involved in cytochrome c biogenesis permease subunit
MAGKREENGMTWDSFIYFALPASALWLAAGGAACVKKGHTLLIDVLMLGGTLIFGLYILLLWQALERPPMRTMGETRLWYSFFLAGIGYIAYKRWNYNWLLFFSAALATIFAAVNLFRPEIHSKALMPALQSPYFVPHVTVYILSYAMLGVATIGAFAQIRKAGRGQTDAALYGFIDNIVYIGFGFLALGMLSGALWAKEAWGHYWSWDPKETWAFITAAGYLAYIHMRLRKTHPLLTLWVLPASFVLLMVCWLGVSYLPSAQGSIHVYS